MYNHNFSLLSLCRKFIIFPRRVSTTFHIPSKPRARDVWFQLFRKVSVNGKEIIHEKNQWFHFFREHKSKSFSAWADTSHTFHYWFNKGKKSKIVKAPEKIVWTKPHISRQKFSKTIKTLSKVREHFPFVILTRVFWLVIKNLKYLRKYPTLLNTWIYKTQVITQLINSEKLFIFGYYVTLCIMDWVLCHIRYYDFGYDFLRPEKILMFARKLTELILQFFTKSPSYAI